MSTAIPPDLSLWEKALIAPALCRTLGSTLYALLASPFRGSKGADTISKHVKIAMCRSLLNNLTIAQSQYIIQPLDSIYPAYAKQQGFKPEIVTMGSGMKGYWIGDPKSEDVLIWYHGGGYTIPPDIGHLAFAEVIVDSAKVVGKNLAVLFPAYSLAPHATYPKQLEQGVEALRYVLEETGRRPEHVMIGGDSAGANLSLGILSHILHPHPSGTIPPITLSAPLKGAIFLSPWFSFSTTDASFYANQHRDYVSDYIGNLWSANFLGGKPRDEYNEPITAAQEWWEEGVDGKGLKDIVERPFVVGGGVEVLLDSIKAVGARLQKAHPQTQILIAQGEVHDECVVSTFGAPGQSKMAEGIREWVKAKL